MDNTKVDESKNTAYFLRQIEELKAKLSVSTAENEKKDKEIIAVKAENEKKDKEIIAVKAENEKKDKEIIAVKAENEKKDMQFSVEDISKNFPSMAVNISCRPSSRNRTAKKKEDCHGISKEYDERPNKKSHKPASIMKENQGSNIRSLVEEIKLNFCDKNQHRIKSLISLEYAKSGLQLKHHNETSPQLYFSYVLKDIVSCNGIGSTDVIMQATLFSLRPDLIVVLQNGRILCAVEIKNPCVQTSEEVFHSEEVAGQVYDYLCGLRQMGIDQPFAILSTFNKTVVVRFNADHDYYNKHLRDGAANANRLPSQRLCGDMEQDVKNKEKSSPEKSKALHLKLSNSHSDPTGETPTKKQKLNADPLDGSGDCKFDEVHDYSKRELVYSEIFQGKDLYKLLSLVLESSLVSVKASTETLRSFFVPTQGKILSADNRMVLTITADSYFFTKPASSSLANYYKPPNFNICKYFHTLCVLGQGGSGKCILCCSTSGAMFAAKLFLIQYSLQYLGTDRVQEQENEINDKQKLAEAELSLWKKLAHEKYHKYLYVLKMNGLPALTMPFFPPIPIENRKEALPKIKEKLEELARQKFVYKEICWRHFGCRWEDDRIEIAALDLGSLEEYKDKSKNINDKVIEHITSLQSRMFKEPTSKPEPVIV